MKNEEWINLRLRTIMDDVELINEGKRHGFEHYLNLFAENQKTIIARLETLIKIMRIK